MSTPGTPIILRHSTTAGSVPVASEFNNHTFVVNHADGLLYWADTSNVVHSLPLTVALILANAVLTGTPTAPTPATGDNSTNIATTQFMTTALANALSKIYTRTQVNDASYTAAATDRTIAVTSLTQSRTITLPLSTSYPTGTTLRIMDESGACSSTKAINLALTTPPSGQNADVLNGASTYAVTSAYGYVELQSNGSGKWTVIDAVTPLPTLASIGAAAIDDVRQLMIQMAKVQGKVAGYASGFADDYADQSGVDTASSSGFVYDATNKLFTNFGQETTQSLAAMTSNSAPSGNTVLASSEYASGNQAWYAYNQTVSNGDCWQSSSASLPQTLQRKTASAITLAAYALTARSDSYFYRTPSTWTFLGSNDGSTWTTLDTQSGVTFTQGQRQLFTIPVANRGSYAYHQIKVTAVQSGAADTYTAIAEVEELQQIGGVLDLRSVAASAYVVPSKAGIFILAKPLNGGVITPNTNLIASVSRTGSASPPTWTQVNLVAAGTIGGFSVFEANGVDISSQASGSSMRTRLQTANGLAIQVQANVMQWG